MRLYLVGNSGFTDSYTERTFGMYMGEGGAMARSMIGGSQLRILLSYHYYQNVDLDKLFAKYFTIPYPDVFADSGGFSAATQGVTIDLQQYAAWVKRWSHLFSAYANLDVIGDAEQTALNQDRLEAEGLTPIPVFHVGEDWSYLDAYIDHYPYIALGGMVPHLRFPKRLMPWLIEAFKRAQGRAVFHGFGATAWRVVRDLPWYSVDSSSWGSGFRYGRVPLFDDQRGGFVTALLGDARSCYQHAAKFRALGFDPADFADRARNERAKICAVALISYMRAEQWLRARHGEICIPGHDDDPGIKTHLVMGSSSVNAKRGGNTSARAIFEAANIDLHGAKVYLSDAQHEVGDIRRAIGELDARSSDS